MNIRETLNDRGKVHGDYGDHARMSQMLKNIMASGVKWKDLEDHEKETLEMVAHKIGRILSGDPHYHDHWHDIVGYATLSADRNAGPALPKADTFDDILKEATKRAIDLPFTPEDVRAGRAGQASVALVPKA